MICYLNTCSSQKNSYVCGSLVYLIEWHGIFFFSSNVSPAQYEAISAQPGMDIWSIKQDRIDIRIPRESEMWLMKLGVHCTIVHESVELLVQQFEQKMKDQQQGWFEQYVWHCKAFARIE